MRLVAILGILMSVSSATGDLPSLDKLWDWDNAPVSEQRFREVLPRARASGDLGYLAELLTQIARAEGRQKKFDQAHKTLDDAQALLLAGPSRARVRYLLERGRVFNSSMHPERARPLFLQAWDAATQAKEEVLGLDAAHMLGIVEPPEKALEWSHKAIALAEASGNPDARKWLGPLYNNTGWTYYEKGDYPRALELLMKAQDFYQKQGTATQIRVAKYSVGKTLRALGKLEEALAIQQKLAAELSAAREQDGYVDEELGECLLALGRGAQSKPHFQRAYQLLSKDDWLVKNEPRRVERLKQLGM